MGMIDSIVLDQYVLASVDKGIFLEIAAFHADSVIACVNNTVDYQRLMAVAEVDCVAVLCVPRTPDGYPVDDKVSAVERMDMELWGVLECHAGEKDVFAIVDAEDIVALLFLFFGGISDVGIAGFQFPRIPQILRLRDEGSTIIFSTHNMASVEEICDHITLINKSHNILSGRVDDLRREWADGHYSLTYTDADPTTFMETLSPLAGTFATSVDTRGRNVLDLRLAPGATLRDLIARANEASTLHSVNEAVASMNDIFISAVKANDPNTLL